MSVSYTRSSIARLQKDISDLRTKDAAEARKEADLLSRFTRAMDGANRASSSATRSTKLREAERAQNDLASVARRRADISKNLASKGNDSVRLQDQLSRDEEQERKKTIALDKKLQADRDKQIQNLDRRLREQSRHVVAERGLPARRGPLAVSMAEQCDAFISHASEDKEDFVRDLADRLQSAGVTVWYDEFSLRVGDSLRRKIDEGLARSRFGVVVLSTHFFQKEWPQRELDGLVALETAGRSRILPIWHKVSKDEVAAFSPTLADKVALNTAVLTIDEIVTRLVEYRDAAIRD